MAIFTYGLQLSDDQDGGFVVTSRDLPEVVTQGDTYAQALEEAEGALQAAIEMRIQDGLPIPLATGLEVGEVWVAVPIATAMKAALYQTMCEQGIERADFARRLGLNEQEMSRFLHDMDLGRVAVWEGALHRLGKRAELHVS